MGPLKKEQIGDLRTTPPCPGFALGALIKKRFHFMPLVIVTQDIKLDTIRPASLGPYKAKSGFMSDIPQKCAPPPHLVKRHFHMAHD
jgi:hypothetical protein